MMGLRITRGLDLDRYEAISGVPLDEMVLQDLVKNGYLNLNNRYLAPTRAGRAVLNAVIRELLPS